MKQLLTALLIAFLVFGCNGNEGDIISISLRPNETILSIYMDDYILSSDSGYLSNAESGVGLSYSVSKDTYYINRTMIDIGDTTSGTDVFYIDSSGNSGYIGDTATPNPQLPISDTTKPLKIKMQPRWRMADGALFILDSFYNDDVKSYWYYFNQATNQDTVKCVFIVSNTNDVNGICQYFDKIGYIVGGSIFNYIEYLDERKRPLPKNIVVWMSKEIKP